MSFTTDGAPRRAQSITPRRQRAASVPVTPSATAGPIDTLVLEGSQRGAAKMLGFVAFVGVSAVSRFYSHADSSDTTQRVMFAALMLLVALGLAHFARRFVHRGVVVRVDAMGISNDASLFFAGHVSWAEIASVEIYEFAQLRTLRIWLRDPDRFLHRQPLWKRMMLRTLMGLGGAPVEIPQALLPIPVEYLLAIITSRGIRRGAA